MDDELADEIRRRRRGQLVGVAFVLIVVLVAAAVGTGAFSGSDPAEDASRVDGVVGTQETTALLRGVPQDGLTLGRPDAPATVVEFVDVKCPFCKEFAIEDGPDLVRDLVRSGRASLELRVLANLGESSVTGRNAILNAASRDRAWTLSELLYYNQRSEALEWLTPQLLQRIGATSPELRGVPLSTRETPESRRLAAETDALAKKLDVGGTPTVFVRPRGRTDAGAYRQVDLRGTGSKAAKIASAVGDLSR